MKVGAEGVYKAIVDLTRYRGHPPTVREICDHVGVNSTSTVHDAIMRLVRDGRIVHDPTKPRTIKLVDKPAERVCVGCGCCAPDYCGGCYDAQEHDYEFELVELRVERDRLRDLAAALEAELAEAEKR